MDLPAIQPQELKSLLDGGGRPVILDVRQPEEVAAASIAGSISIPMAEIPARHKELDPAASIVVYCHHGVRSANVAIFLRNAGFKDVKNLAGGIDAWSATVDPGVPRYRYDGRRVQVLGSPGR